jgi:hypothetical protein
VKEEGSLEAVMTKQLTHSQHLISIGGTGLAVLGLGVTASHLNHLGCVAIRMALEMLPRIVPLAWRASQVLASDYPRLFEHLCQFASVWRFVACLVRSV